MGIQVIENHYLRVSLDGAKGWFDVLGKETGAVWQHDPFENSPGELILKRKGDGGLVALDLGKASNVTVKKTSSLEAELQFTALKTEDGQDVPDVSVKTRIAVDKEEPDLKVEVQEVVYSDKWQMISLLYPARSFFLKTFTDEGYLVIPYHGQGSIVPSSRFKEVPHLNFPNWDDQSYMETAYVELEVYASGGLMMPWFGAVKGQSAFICVLETPNDAAVSCILNYNLQHVFSQRFETSPYPRIASASSLWRSQKGEFGYPRYQIYHFIPRRNYVNMAKYYREVAKKNGLLKTLREKVKENPNVEKLLGSVMLNIVCWGYPWYTDYEAYKHTWRDVKKTIIDLHDNLGVERALLIIWGGYSKLPPESWPFDLKMGTLEEMREAVRAAHQRGYLFCFYHGYPSLLEHASSWDPKLARKDERGAMSRGHWGRLCSEFYLKYARENLPKTVGESGQIADYEDILTCGRLSECYDPGHPTTRTKDRENKIELLKYIKSLGLVVGCECIRGWAVPHMNYAKGGLFGGSPPYMLRAISVPLFNLVYHDCLVAYGSYGMTHYRENLLKELAYGSPPQFEFTRGYRGTGEDYVGFKDDIRQISNIFYDLTKAVALDELVNHEYLTDAYDVERTTFSSGVKVTINLSKRNATVEGRKVPSRGFLIEYPNGEIQTGQIKTLATKKMQRK